MSEKRFLNEENYQKSKNKVIMIAIIVLAIGILIGGSLIVVGLSKKAEVNNQYSDSSKATELKKLTEEKNKISEELETEKQNVLKSKAELEEKIKPVNEEIKSLEREKFTGFDDAYYAREDKIEELKKSIEEYENSIKVIEDALSTGFDHCAFSAAKNNSYTSKYCSLKNKLKQKDSEIEGIDNKYNDFNKESDSYASISFYVFGGIIIIISCSIAGSIYLFAKRRDILAFTANQTVPVAKEVIEDVAPSIGKAAGSIKKEMNDVAGESTANVMGNIAKNISKGIKEGINEADKKDKDNKKNND